MSIPLLVAPIIHHGTRVVVDPAYDRRNRLTVAFRPILAIPHLLLVGAPIAFGLTTGGHSVDGTRLDWATGGGVLGIVAGVSAMIAWFAILFTGTYPGGLWNLAASYVRWRVRAMAYIALLRDEYPPFGEGEYAARVYLAEPEAHRNRLSVAFRIILLIPHFIVLWPLSVLWLLTTVAAWVCILVRGAYPRALYEYGVAVLRWTVRVEAYLLLLHDEYPPFTLE